MRQIEYRAASFDQKNKDEFSNSITAISEDKYFLYSHALNRRAFSSKDYMHGKDPTYTGKVSFEVLPEEFQRKLFLLACNFPQWPVYTAADPEFFTLTLGDTDVAEYAKKRASFWIGLQNEIIDAVPAFQEMQKKIAEQKQLEINARRAQLPPFQSSSYDKDPIFYMPIQKTYKNITYNLTIVYGQHGQSPHEKEVIARLNKINTEYFMGVEAN